jgi:hypothetical protein
MEEPFTSSYRYTLNGVYHEIRDPKVIAKIQEEVPASSESRHRQLVSQKFLLKYLHDLFEIHQIDYTLFHQTLQGQKTFQGIHIYEKKIEICMMYRPLQALIGQDLLRDGFFIDYESPYFAVISTQFFDSIVVKAYIYFLQRERDPNSQTSQPLVFLNPASVARIKKYSEIPIQATHDYNLLRTPLSTIFPPQRAPYEDFEVCLPHKPNLLLSLYTQPTTSTSTSTSTHTHTPNPEEESDAISNSAPGIPIFQHLFSFLKGSS